MARFVYATFAGLGRLNVAAATVRRLLGLGHEVVVFAPDDLTPRLAGMDVAARCVTPQFVHLANSEAFNRAGVLAERMMNARYLYNFYRLSLLNRLDEQVAALAECVRAVQPDVLAADPLFFAAAVVGEREGIPWACLSPTLLPVAPADYRDPVLDVMARIGERARRMCAACGAAPELVRGQLVSPWLNVVFTVEAFASRSAARNDYSHYVGPIASPPITSEPSTFSWDAIAADTPLIYVTGGTQAGFTPAQFQVIAQALEGTSTTCVLALFDAYREDVVRDIPAHARAFRFVPQAALLERASLLVCHGGANTVMDGLMHGVPVLAIPRGHDQGVQAALLEASGAGRRLAADELTLARCRELTTSMLPATAPERRSARAIADACRDADGAVGAADLLLELAGSRRPLKPS
jgi:MGT family glycosyltransferase